MRVDLNKNTIKIINAFTQLARLNESITIYSISKISGLNWHTVKFYLHNDLKIKGILCLSVSCFSFSAVCNVTSKFSITQGPAIRKKTGSGLSPDLLSKSKK